MKCPSSILLAAVMIVSAIAGCSVKEDRGGCPCRLYLDMANVDMSVMSPLSLYVASVDGLVHEAVLDSGYSGSVYEAYVAREELDIAGWSGARDYVSQEGLSIPLGYDCPPVYIHSSSVHAEGESVRDTLRMRKNHCVLNVRFISAEAFSAMTIRGSVAGFDRRGYPKPGEFRVYCSMDSLEESSTQVCLPRQVGDPLYLDVTDSNGKLRTFPLREYIAATGYDWSEPDLKDLDLTLNYTLTTVSLVVSGWDEEFIFDVVI